MPKGRPRQPHEDPRKTVMETRMRHYRVSKEVAMTDAMGSPLGRLVHWRVITQAQADAGYDFAVTIREYLATAKLPKPSQNKAGFVPAKIDNSEGPAVRGQAKAQAYMEALKRLDLGRSPSVTSIVWDVCINENDRSGKKTMASLEAGLDAIHRIQHGRKAA